MTTQFLWATPSRPVMVNDWLIVLVDERHDTGEVIGTAPTFVAAQAMADKADISEGRRAVVAPVAYICQAGLPSRRTRLYGNLLVPGVLARAPSVEQITRPAPREPGWLLFPLCAAIVVLAALAIPNLKGMF